jgi:hypothetical protein
MNAQIARHLNIAPTAIIEVQEWARVLLVRFIGGCRFVSKKVKNMIVCQRSGLAFDPTSSRQKNHPQISAWLQEANKDGWYRECAEAIDLGKKKGFDRIEHFGELIAVAKDKSLKSAEWERRKAENNDRATRRAVIKETFHRNGYQWHSNRSIPTDSPFGLSDDSGEIQFWLESPDGREVSEAQALKEIYSNPDSIVCWKSGKYFPAGTDSSKWF